MDPFIEEILEGLRATAQGYVQGPLVHPAIRALATHGQPGWESGMSLLPNNLRTMDFLQQGAGRLMADAWNRNKAPGPLEPHRSAKDVLQWRVGQDMRELPNAHLAQAGHANAMGVFDRFFFPQVLQQMQSDPYFAPLIQELLGGSAPPSQWE